MWHIYKYITIPNNITTSFTEIQRLLNDILIYYLLGLVIEVIDERENMYFYIHCCLMLMQKQLRMC